MSVNLPEQVKQMVEKTNKIFSDNKCYLENHPPVGRPRKKLLKPKPVSIVVAKTVLEINTVLEIASKAMGARTRGNKRWGRKQKAFYVDLVGYFIALQKQGCKLPRYHLSIAACSTELEEILVRHGHLLYSDTLNETHGRTSLFKMISSM